MNRIAVAREMGSPLHHQIYLVLADGISTGRYAVGEALPTEEQLTQMFSVSRITVRRAMASLHDAGLIERGAGRRTVVRPQIGQTMRMPMSSVIENIVAYGAETVAKVVEFGYVEARGFAREKLWQADRPVQRAVRVRSQNGVPVMHLVSYVPEALGRTFTAEELNRIPLYKLLGRAGVQDRRRPAARIGRAGRAAGRVAAGRQGRRCPDRPAQPDDRQRGPRRRIRRDAGRARAFEAALRHAARAV